ncbi:NFX1-type zinc finger-containing protein 1-like [Centruroides vittatus]|uniref:NFX1-type zinc finger-containing protein 1-like n=1 Tax=Centruroides vittatus TaxID=120091 RepID=UPI00350F29F6
MGKNKHKNSQNKKSSAKKSKQKAVKNDVVNSAACGTSSKRDLEDVKELEVEHNWGLFTTSLKLLRSFKLMQNDETDNEDEGDEQRKKEFDFITKTQELRKRKKKPPPSLKVAKKTDEPPSEFRALSITPNRRDLKYDKPFIRPNLVKGKYEDVDHYLDVQFRLFREDYIHPLREGIKDYHKELKEMNAIYSREFRTVYVYENIKILNPYLDNANGLLFMLAFPSFPGNFNWENSKRLQEGTLLCLSVDNFEDNFIFAIVINREIAKVSKGNIMIQFEQDTDFVYEHPNATYTMLETKGGYFESYRHTLKILKELNEDNFPLKDYITVHRKKVKSPCYLDKTSTYNFRILFGEYSCKKLTKTTDGFEKSESDDKSVDLKVWGLQNENLKEIHNRDNGWLSDDDDDEESSSSCNENNLKSKDFSIEKVPILKYSKWPTKEVLKLDESQYEVLKAALTKEFTIIQGPPGTGKTFIGLQIVKLLLYNRELWYPKDVRDDEECPILIVCYTNHALDQFLERILQFTEKVVRIGSQGESEKLENYKISNLRMKDEYSICKSTDKKRLQIKRTRLKNQVHICYMTIEAASRIIFPLPVLKNYMRGDQYEYLNRMTCKSGKIRSNLEEWLEVPYDDEIKDAFDRDVLDTGTIGLDDDICSWLPPAAMTEIISHSSWNERRSNKHEEHIMENMKNGYERNLDDQNRRIMTEEEANECVLDDSLQVSDRWRLYRFWVAKFINFVKEQMNNYQNAFNNTVKTLKQFNLDKDINILKHNLVVGMTCTGAAKFHRLIEEVGPQIIIIEEAAEVLETHLITSLTKSMKHLIMIGDHQQLQPLPTVHELGEKCEMKVSLFERMVRNEIECYTLTTQHRMRRNIAQLLVPHIYERLNSHSSVDDYEDIKGLDKNVFFINHSHMEKETSVSSYCNDYEARFIAQLSRYLIYQEYESDQITILATYSGQVKLIQTEMKKVAEECEESVKDHLQGTKVTSVDNYQGEENDIILISFVRSNYESKIGFLSRANRVCVALSRARKGLYCIGNFDLLESVSDLWKAIVEDLKDQSSIDSSINLVCQKHKNTTNVQLIRDFKNVSNGGCEEKCNAKLECGHNCKRYCHVFDTAHNLYKCDEKCNNKCKFGHPCKKKCHEQCGECKIIRMAKLPCGHCYPIPCHVEKPSDFKCRKPCEKMLKCGHACDKKCSDECEPCLRMVPKTFPDCKHTIRLQCNVKLEEEKCSEPCPYFLPCGHPCAKSCGVRPCPEKCERMIIVHLPCGHAKEQMCSEEKDYSCFAPCCFKLSCGHSCTGNCTLCRNSHKRCVAKCGKRLHNGMTCKLVCQHDGPCNSDFIPKFRKGSGKSNDKDDSGPRRDRHKVNKWKTDFEYE